MKTENLVGGGKKGKTKKKKPKKKQKQTQQNPGKGGGPGMSHFGPPQHPREKDQIKRAVCGGGGDDTGSKRKGTDLGGFGQGTPEKLAHPRGFRGDALVAQRAVFFCFTCFFFFLAGFFFRASGG